MTPLDSRRAQHPSFNHAHKFLSGCLALGRGQNSWKLRLRVPGPRRRLDSSRRVWAW